MRMLLVILSGLEPETYCLEGSCSIQLSYRTIISNFVNSNQKPSRVVGMLYPVELQDHYFKFCELKPETFPIDRDALSN